MRDFIGQFRGLKGTAKQNAICARDRRRRAGDAGGFLPARPMRRVKLLVAMRRSSRPVKPRDLGVIGEDHLSGVCSTTAAIWNSIVYRKAEIEHDGLPYVIEVAFGYREDDAERRAGRRGLQLRPGHWRLPIQARRASGGAPTSTSATRSPCSPMSPARGSISSTGARRESICPTRSPTSSTR